MNEREWLTAEIERLRKIEDYCDRAGELDGLTPARAQRRALEKGLFDLGPAD
jgi:hypothetical protein